MAAKIAEIFTEMFKKQILGQVIENTKKRAKVIVEEKVNKDLLEYGT
jgi:hypothetical protein